jgi:hypothetical protein
LLASLFIIAASLALFLYWFRYTCLLILAQRSAADYALKVASTIRLSFPQVQQVLQAEPQTLALDWVHSGLENDYRILTDLLRQATGSDTIEHRILAIDYKVMQIRYRLTRTNGNLAHARKALAEMSSILGYFAEELGQGAAA